jgi:hypothetical protein
MRRLVPWTLAAVLVAAVACPGFARQPASDDEPSLTLDPREGLEQAVALSVAAGADGLRLARGDDGLYASHGLYTSPIRDVERPFNAVLFSYRADLPPGSALEFFVRAWHGDQPSRWYQVDTEDEALFEAPAERIQYRVLLSTQTLDQTPVLREVSLTFADANLAAPDVAGGPTVAVAAPPIVERADWGARKPSSSYRTHKVSLLIVHHTSIPTQADYAGAATIKGIQTAHMDDRHWIDIGYHFLIGTEGKVYRGRPETVIGSHCIPNTAKVGISVIGDYQSEQPTAAARAALVQLLAHLAGKHGLTVQRIAGHKDYMSTDCPGDNLYSQLPALRAEAQALLDAAAGR